MCVLGQRDFLFFLFLSKDSQVNARLVARGFEDDCVDTRTDSPTRSKMNLRLTVTVASSKGWEINSLNI